MSNVENLDGDETPAERVPVLSWTCFPCGETHASNVPLGTKGNQPILVTCPETGEKRKVMAVPFFLLSSD